MIFKTLKNNNIKQIIDLQSEILKSLSDEELFQPDDLTMINRCINDLSLGCFISSTLVAYLLIFTPVSIDESYSRFKDKKLSVDKIAHFETAIVDNEYRGKNLQYYLFKESINILKNRNIHYIYSLCSPKNIPSIKNFQKLEMKDILCIRTFGNKRRIVFFKDLIS